MDNKHYIRTDVNGYIIKSFSDAFEQPLLTDKLTEEGGRHYNLDLWDNGIPKLKYDTTIRPCTQAEIDAYKVILSLGTTLTQAQQSKISQINNLYYQKLTDGFTSSATGKAYVFGYDSTDQLKFIQLAILVISNMAIFPFNIPAKDNTIISHTLAQYNQLVSDIATFAQAQNVKQHQYINQVNACTTIDAVNAIVVIF